MKYPENIQAVADLLPDYLGFIFYPKSKRFVLDEHKDAFNSFMYDDNLRVQKVAVFVNESLKNIIRIATDYNIQIIQLHGDESSEFCEELQLLGFQVIKAFGVDADFSFASLDEYESVCDFFLFDTKTSDYGGTGQHFNWDLLSNYHLQKPFFLSGGLTINDLPKLKSLANQLPIHALDFNSKLEISPAMKDIEQCQLLINAIRNATK